MQLGVITITYNLPPEVFLLQEESLRKYCRDEYVLVVVDNSSKEDMAEAIRYHCEIKGIEYMRTRATSENGSDSHAFALNVAHNRFVSEYDNLVYLDHDVIPFKEFSPMEMLKDNVLCGIMQGKNKYYLWPGCIFISKEVKDRVDFNPCNQLGLDTGGMNWRLLEEYKGRIMEFSEEYRQNDQYGGKYNFYTIINGMFMHFINASSWNQVEDNQTRINSLLNIYKTLEQ